MPEFRSPILYFGEDSLEMLDMIDGEKAFVVTDKGIIEVGLMEILTDALNNADKEYAVFDGVEPDPFESTVLEGLKACNECNPDLIIGLGGGSSIDTAKAIWFLYEHPDKELDDFNPFEPMHMGVKAKMIAIPTTAGTGAEATWASIITRVDDKEQHFKLELSHRDVTPTIAIVDPIFTKNLPKNLTTSTAFDALGHSFEGLISEWRNTLSDAMCFHAIDLIFEYLPQVVKDGHDLNARDKLAAAATIAGLGFGNSQVVLGHAAAHAIGAVFHLPHGLGVGIMLPYILEYSLENGENELTRKTLAKVSRKQGFCNWDMDELQAAKECIKSIKKLQKDMGFPTTLADAGIKKDELKAKMKRIIQLTQESPSVAMNPRDISNAEVEQLVLYSFEGKEIDF